MLASGWHPLLQQVLPMSSMHMMSADPQPRAACLAWADFLSGPLVLSYGDGCHCYLHTYRYRMGQMLAMIWYLQFSSCMQIGSVWRMLLAALTFKLIWQRIRRHAQSESATRPTERDTVRWQLYSFL